MEPDLLIADIHPTNFERQQALEISADTSVRIL